MARKDPALEIVPTVSEAEGPVAGPGAEAARAVTRAQHSKPHPPGLEVAGLSRCPWTAQGSREVSHSQAWRRAARLDLLGAALHQPAPWPISTHQHGSCTGFPQCYSFQVSWGNAVLAPGMPFPHCQASVGGHEGPCLGFTPTHHPAGAAGGSGFVPALEETLCPWLGLPAACREQ